MANIRGELVVKPHVQGFVDELEKKTGRVLSFGTYNGHQPSYDLAIDIFHAVGDNDLADWICNFAVAYWEKYGIQYVISRKRIRNLEITTIWRDMADRGTVTKNHFDHVHISFYPTAPNFKGGFMAEVNVTQVEWDGVKTQIREIWENLFYLQTLYKEIVGSMGEGAVGSRVDEIMGMLEKISDQVDNNDKSDQV